MQWGMTDGGFLTAFSYRLWDRVSTSGQKENFLAVNTYFKKEQIALINYLTFYLWNLKKKKIKLEQAERRITKIRVNLNGIKKKKIITTIYYFTCVRIGYN